MLRIFQSSASADAKGYFSAELSKGDYYTENQQIAGRWGGKAAAFLGLHGDVDKAGFHALCDNLHPGTGKQLTPRQKENRRVGYDISFHCPKSVSVLFERTQDPVIIDTFRSAVAETMREMEGAMRTQSTVAGEKVKPITGNMVWAEFIHLTSRPVGDRLPDPHLHAHCFTFNTTFDQAEGRWKAAEFVRLYYDAPYYQAAFHARLALGLRQMGFAIERTEHAFELAGVPASVLEKFSKRTSEIETLASERGITDDREKDKLGAFTRGRKKLDFSKEALREGWGSQFTPGELAAIAAVAAKNGGHGIAIGETAALDYAVAHSFERASVVDHKRLLATALHHGVGDVDVAAMLREGQRNGILTREIDGMTLSTTVEVLIEEKAMTDFARRTLNTCRPLVAEREAISDDALSEEQKMAIRHVWRSANQVTGIIGGAGVGKTRLMTEAVRGIEANGHKVFTFAPSAGASRGVLRDEGFGEADTVAKLFQDAGLQQRLRGQVIWIDEAGLLGVKDLRQVFEIAQEQGARVVLSGDSKQHAPVARGDALRILENQAGIEFPEVRTIQRQKAEVYREAVKDLSKGNVDRAFDRLEEMGAIQEIADRDERHAALAKDYAKLQSQGKTVLVVSPTHAEGAAVTHAIRSELRQAGKLGEAREFTSLENLQWTEAQKGDARNYEPGMVIQFHQNVGELKTREAVLGVGSPGNVAGVKQVPADGRREFYLDLDERGVVLKSRDREAAAGGEYVLAYGRPGNPFRVEKMPARGDREYYFAMGKDGPELRVRSKSERQAGGRGWTFAMGPDGPVLTEKTRRVSVNNGDRLHVLGRDQRGHVMVAGKSGDAFALPASQASKFQVYQRKNLEVAQGDVLRMTRNGYSEDNKRINNGDLAEVKRFTPNGGIELTNGKILAADQGHIAHGRVATSHGSQGKTVDHVLIAQSSASNGAASKEQAYVSISRGREGVKIYCDDKQALREAVKHSSQRQSATDVAGGVQPSASRERGKLLGRLGSMARSYAGRAKDQVKGWMQNVGSRGQVATNQAMVRMRGRGNGFQLG